MADEPAQKQTLVQKALFYTTAFFILLGTFSLFAFLFLVPFIIDPAFTTIFMQFDENPALCVTVDVVNKAGSSNCTWSSCKEGCTRELYQCTQIRVNYRPADDPSANVSEAVVASRAKRSLLEESLLRLAGGYSALFASRGAEGEEERTARVERAIRDYSDYDDMQTPANVSDWFFRARLFPNVKGCGYPPVLNCSVFLSKYQRLGANYSCYYSRIDPKLVITEFDLRQVYMNLVYSMAIPIPSFIISLIYLVLAYFVIYAEEPAEPAQPDTAASGATPVPPPTSGALTPASEVFREDLASFGHDLKVAMADEASRESVATCTDAVPNSNSIADGSQSSSIGEVHLNTVQALYLQPGYLPPTRGRLVLPPIG